MTDIEQKKEHWVNELVSKRGVILMYKRLTDFEHLDEESFIESVKALTSAQPEIIHCGDCKYCISHCCYERIHIRIGLFVDNDNFCKWAERK